MPKFFSEIATRPARAAQMWQILVAKACNRQTATYSEVADILGFKGARTLAPMLDYIYRYCRQNKLPLLNVIVVNQKSGLPGIGLDIDMNAEREKVFRFDWYDVVPPAFDELQAAYKKGA